MAQTTLSVRMDAETKKQLEEFCAAVGMTPSTAINLFAKAVIRERRIPFEISAAPVGDWNDPEQVRQKLTEAETAICEGRVFPAEKAVAQIREKYAL